MKYGITILCILLSLNSSAQSYTKMLGETNRWVTEYIAFGFSTVEQLSTKSDTIVNGYEYYKMQFYDSTVIAYLREDVVNKQIFIAELDANDSILFNSESLLYDFGRSIGDTIIVRGLAFENRFFTSDTLILDTIEVGDSFFLHNYLLPSDSVRIFYLSSMHPLFGSGIVWIEGVGSYTGILFPSVDVGGPSFLCCYSRDSILEFRCDFPIENDSCYQKALAAGGIISIEKKLSPTSFNLFQKEGILYINAFEPRSSVTSIRIIDPNGRELLKQRFNTPKTEFRFDISNFPIGLYYVQVLTDDGFYAKSFVKRK